MQLALGTDPLDSGALISPCECYRWKLWRIWDPTLPILCFVMLNPSKADAKDDDPTITRCIARARRLGYGGIIVVNLYAWRATDPDELPKVKNPVGAENDHHVLEAARLAAAGMGMVICAWGGEHLRGRDDHVIKLLQGAGIALHALAFTKGGKPCHPLYLSYKLLPQPWAPRSLP